MHEGRLLIAQTDTASTSRWVSAWLLQRRCFLGETVWPLIAFQPFKEASTSIRVPTQSSALLTQGRAGPERSLAKTLGWWRSAGTGLPWRSGHTRRASPQPGAPEFCKATEFLSTDFYIFFWSSTDSIFQEPRVQSVLHHFAFSLHQAVLHNLCLLNQVVQRMCFWAFDGSAHRTSTAVVLITSHLVSCNPYGRLDPLPWIPTLDFITLLPKFP